MAILFSSSDDCRWPKIQFKKPEKIFFVSRKFSRFCNILLLFSSCLLFFRWFSNFFDHIFVFWCFFDYPFYFSKSIILIFRKNEKINKASKNKNIGMNNEKMIWFCCFSSCPLRKNKLQKCFKKPFLGLALYHMVLVVL